MSSLKRPRELDVAEEEHEAKVITPVEEEKREEECPVQEVIVHEDDEDDRINLPMSSSRASVKKGKECPYLDTISRQVKSSSDRCQEACEHAWQ